MRLRPGVMFTANPITGSRNETVIDASPGLGEAVVSGAVNPDHFVVNSVDHRIVTRRLGDKRMMITSRPGGGTERHELADRSSEACLDDEQVLQLVDLGQRVQRHYGAPQDTEWALDSSRPLLVDPGAADHHACTRWRAPIGRACGC